MIEHQPGYQFGEYLPGKGHLVHGLIVRADLDVVPPSERDREPLADPGAQLLGLGMSLLFGGFAVPLAIPLAAVADQVQAYEPVAGRQGLFKFTQMRALLHR